MVAEKLIETGIFFTKSDNKSTTRMGFEPTRGDPNGLAVHHLNRSVTSSLFFSELYSTELTY